MKANRSMIAVTGILALCSLAVAPDTRAVEWPAVADLPARIREVWPDVPSPGPGHTNAEAYLRALAPRVLLGPGNAGGSPLLTRTNRYAGGASAYLRVGEVRAGLAEAVGAALRDLAPSGGAVSGLVIDLRFAGGTDFAEANAAAGRFAPRSPDAPGSGDLSPTIPPGTNGTSSLPLMVLVNRQTAGAAEVLAAKLRRAVTPSLLIGTNTAGQARTYVPIVLPGGEVVRIGGDPLGVTSGITLDGSLVPDLQVAVDEADERHYFTNEFQRVLNGQPVVPPGAGGRFRLNEAELVRRRGERGTGDPFSDPDAPRDLRRSLRPRGQVVEPVGQAESPVVDPILARALDLLAGLAAVPPPSSGDSR